MPEACIHIVDDDDAVRRTLVYTLGSSGYATRIYETAEQILRNAERLAPGCILTDVRMPGMDGVELVRQLRERLVPHPIVVMSGHADVATAVEAMKVGARDFIEKPFRSTALVSAVASALENESRLPQDAAASAYRKMLETLSPRQREVLKGILAGKLNKTIAHELNLSVRTVEGYRAEIMSRTRAAGLTDLVRMAVLAGY